MTIASMTGFSRETGVSGPFRWAWEIRSVNGRGLDMRLKTPVGYEAFGEEARLALAKAVTRGTCHVGLVVSKVEADPTIRINEEALAAVLAAISRVDLPDGIRPASLDGLLAIRGVVEASVEDDAPDVQEALAADLKAGLGRAVAGLVAARAREGVALATVLSEQLDRISAATAAAEANPARQPEAVRARLAEQVALLLEATQALDASRLHQEAALLAAKADIREELDRLAAHVVAARGLLAEGGACGRKLDFLAQEFGREANTLCAKANDVSLTTIGLDLKATIDQFREQSQNVE
ncbi:MULTISPECIES: YicC/YloC family endoribonuclease [unclassified Chelatococcus]|uniref:YicC/YloC family endoribonuclease n=1 Tax=unclassified Chelatococcus TaxID=2638111 RepID=UPI001BD139BC|nr:MULTISPECIES: YicC/YloC family endoribonuclease [unclassified Chelatococcus]CAH1670439.1 Protein YicC [Hyphomicrobiales bacterium]MBS7738337.1 YicC family protein [Chelatococcus sp. HY11]MBX3545865.1 YicC family protein [Chelatococcus sp.]MCO5077317.1 YicC family protein [Chelatococcus sp.]CAH1677329.1 Protein YicC [Hyphomicrobiales bacterium]